MVCHPCTKEVSAIPHGASPVTHPTVLNCNGQVAALIETAELGVWRILPDFKGARHRRNDWPHLLPANSQRRACAAGRVLVGGCTGLLEVVWPRHLGRVAELGRGIVVVRIVLGVGRLCPPPQMSRPGAARGHAARSAGRAGRRSALTRGGPWPPGRLLAAMGRVLSKQLSVSLWPHLPRANTWLPARWDWT